MEKIIRILQRLLKNILNYNMDKSEKSFYVIIKNKKCGKFSGAGPIQVAKKVASKKLKAGKEMEFYLDEAGGKKNRYGPYQATKDKKSGKVSVVKGRKVMKGGLLSSSDRQILTSAFNNNNIIGRSGFIKQVNVDIKIYFVAQSVLIFFKKTEEERERYTHAIFVDPNRTYVWILKKNDDTVVVFISFADFFLNQEYLSELERNYIIQNLNTNILSIRRDEANIINPILSDINSVIKPLNKKSNIGIYLPDYSQPLIRKCVYPDLTFGKLDEQKSVRISQNNTEFQIPESPYQRFLILTNTGIRGMSVNEPIIYVRQSELQLQQQQLQLQQQQPPHFDYCIFSSGYNQLKIMSQGNVNYDFTLYNPDLMNIKKEIFQNLVDIPEQFGRLKRIKDISRIQIIQQTQAIRQKSSINKLEIAIGRLFNKATITNFKINEELLTNAISPIRQRIEYLKGQIGTLPEQQFEQQISNIYVNIGQIFENVLRQSQLQRQ